MDKLEFIARQLSRAHKKKYEHYVVSRIFHLLDNTDVKIITQQYISRPEGYALADLYFPQLDLYVEVDETHHLTQKEADLARMEDITNATGFEGERVITANNSLDDVNQNISKLVGRLKSIIDKRILDGTFERWDLVAEMNPETYIKKGHIDASENIAFPTMVDAANCFGKTYRPMGIWKGGVKHPCEENSLIWFPKLYPNGGWNNTMTSDEMVIYEKNVDADKDKSHVDLFKYNSSIHRRIVFPRVKGPLGDMMYRFKGVYELDVGTSNYREGLVWRRTSKRAKTYSPVSE